MSEFVQIITCLISNNFIKNQIYNSSVQHSQQIAIGKTSLTKTDESINQSSIFQDYYIHINVRSQMDFWISFEECGGSFSSQSFSYMTRSVFGGMQRRQNCMLFRNEERLFENFPKIHLFCFFVTASF